MGMHIAVIDSSTLVPPKEFLAMVKAVATQLRLFGEVEHPA